MGSPLPTDQGTAGQAAGAAAQYQASMDEQGRLLAVQEQPEGQATVLPGRAPPAQREEVLCYQGNQGQER